MKERVNISLYNGPTTDWIKSIPERVLKQQLLFPYPDYQAELNLIMMNLPLLIGEVELENGKTTGGTLVLTDYRLVLCFSDDNIASIPIGLIDEILRNYNGLSIFTKQCRHFICNFETSSECVYWYKRLTEAVAELRNLDNIFAFKYYSALHAKALKPNAEPSKEDEVLVDQKHNQTTIEEATREQPQQQLDQDGIENGNHKKDSTLNQPQRKSHDDKLSDICNQLEQHNLEEEDEEDDLVTEAKQELIGVEDNNVLLHQKLRPRSPHESPSPSPPPPSPSPPSEEQRHQQLNQHQNRHQPLARENGQELCYSVERLSWINARIRTPLTSKVQSLYLNNPSKVEESLTYFEYIRLGFHKDLTFPDQIDNTSAGETSNEDLKESKPRWRISTANQNFELCSSYPRYLIVPADINDDNVKTISNFRYQGRLPAISWRYFKNGCVIARCSQPYVGWWGSRCDMDENFAFLIVKNSMNLSNRNNANAANAANNQESQGQEVIPDANAQGGQDVIDGANIAPFQEANQGDPTGDSSLESDADMVEDITFNNQESSSEKKLLVVDARSYTAAMINRAKGGGCECVEYYPWCEIQFMGLANIHSIRKSFNSLRLLSDYETYSETWYTVLNNSKWLFYLSCLLKSSINIVEAIADERSVLVHCSDGWDRTPQLVSLVQLMMDPFYRTYEGFRVLVEKEWLEFGHKFADRNAVNADFDDPYEKCPIFLQWLDSIHQMIVQDPKAFEFNTFFLECLLYHTYSCLFGTFLCNNIADRVRKNVYLRSPSLWSYLDSMKDRFINKDFSPREGDDHIVTPSAEVSDLRLWTEVYYPSQADVIQMNDRELFNN